jgi:phosphoribosylamine--glycine ligase
VRILGIGETCDLGSLYLRLIAGGDEVRVSVSEPLAAGTMAGMVPRTGDWRAELDWIREAGADGLILFEAVGFGALQDQLRSEGFQVIGGSALGDRLEEDRDYAQRVLADCGLRIAPVAAFTDAQAAIDDLARRPRRCVFKLSASAGETFVGAHPDGRDIAALLRSRPPEDAQPFILMDHVEGIETGIGAYFDGDKFLRPACLDWEHKRFFAGDMGELTGEMGTVATYEASDALFEATLLPLEPLLREAGHVGYVNLNSVINAEGVWPLEFTCRFGYPGFAVLEPLQALGWGELFQTMLRRDSPRFPTNPGFSHAIVLSTPPFPLSRKQVDYPVGLPILADNVPAEHLHWGEVGLADGEPVTAGLYGWTAVVTATGDTVLEAKSAAYARAERVRCANLRYRLDIGDKLIAGALERLASWGWLKSMPPSRIASQIVR